MNFVNPHRGEGEYWIMYTTEEGGGFHPLGASPEAYIDIIEKGYFELKTGDRPADKIYPAFMQLVKVIDGYDFVLREINKANKNENSFHL